MHVSLSAGAFLVKDSLAAARVVGSISKYAEPDADGVKPVLRTEFHTSISANSWVKQSFGIFHRRAGPTDFPELIRCPCSLCKRGGLTIQGGNKDWQRTTTRRAIDATPVRHALSKSGSTSSTA